MAITISGENNNDRILASDGVIDQISGINIVGVLTATSFTGDLTGDVTGNLTGNVTGNINNSTLLLQTGGTERLRIDQYGRVMIGTTTVGDAGADDFNVATSGQTGITIRSGTSSGGQIYFADGTSGDDRYRGIISYQHGSNYMRFYTNAVERLRIDSSGRVGIGTNTMDSSAEVSITNATSSARVYMKSADNADCSIYFGSMNDAATGAIRYDHSDDSLRLYGYNNSERLRIDSGGSVRIANTNFSAAGNADELVIGTTSGNRGLTIVSGNTGIGALFFADDGSTNIGSLVYEHNTNQMRMNVAGAQIMRLDYTSSIPTWIYGSDTNTYTSLPASDTIAFTTGGTERLRITSSQTRIGSQAPTDTTSYEIQLSGAANNDAILSLYNPTTNNGEGINFGFFFKNSNDTVTEFARITSTAMETTASTARGDLRFYTRQGSGGISNASERLRIDENGNIGVNAIPATSGTLYSTVDHFLVIGDSDTGIAQDGDGQLELWANNQEIANFNTGQVTLKKVTQINNSIGVGILPSTSGSGTQFGARTYKIAIGDVDSGIAQNGDGNICLYGNNEEVFRIDNYGNAGLGVAPRTAAGGVNNDTDVFLAIGDNDTGIAQDGDGQFEIWANNQEIANFNAASVTLTKDLYIPDKLRHDGDSDTQIRFPDADTFTVETAGSERLRITSAGKIGIGIASPTFAAGGGVHLKGGNEFTSYRVTAHTNTGVDFAQDASGNAYVYNRDNADLLLGTNNAQKFRIYDDGYAILGDTSKSNTAGAGGFDIQGNSTNCILEMGNPFPGVSGGVVPAFRITATNSNKNVDFESIWGGTNQLYKHITFAGGNTMFYNGTNDTEIVRITGSALMVGTTSNSATTQAKGIALGNDGSMVSRRDGVMHYYKSIATGGYYANVFMSANTTVGSIFFNSGGTQFNTSSDYRRKENVVSLTDGISKLKQLKPYRFNFKDNPSETVDGFLAHEAQEIVPHTVTGTKDQVSTSNDVAVGIASTVGEPIYQQMDLSKLVPLLTAALQDEISKREALEARVAALEGS